MRIFTAAYNSVSRSYGRTVEEAIERLNPPHNEMVSVDEYEIKRVVFTGMGWAEKHYPHPRPQFFNANAELISFNYKPEIPMTGTVLYIFTPDAEHISTKEYLYLPLYEPIDA